MSDTFDGFDPGHVRAALGMSPHPEPAQGDHGEDRARLHQLLLRLTRAAAGHADSSVRSPQDMTRAWAVVDVHQRASAALTALALVRVVARAEAAERDLAALQQERDDWRMAFETANEAIGTMESSHADALREAFEAGMSAVTTEDGWDFEVCPGKGGKREREEAFAAFLAAREND